MRTVWWIKHIFLGAHRGPDSWQAWWEKSIAKARFIVRRNKLDIVAIHLARRLIKCLGVYGPLLGLILLGIVNQLTNRPWHGRRYRQYELVRPHGPWYTHAIVIRHFRVFDLWVNIRCLDCAYLMSRPAYNWHINHGAYSVPPEASGCRYDCIVQLSAII
jgi:hypothetical protein